METSQILYVTWAYVLGSLSAIVYKMSVGSAKHLIGRTFRLRMLVLPVAVATLISIPLVCMIMPRFGPPTGRPMNDVIYAFLTTYATIDMTADFYIVSELYRQHIQKTLKAEEAWNETREE